MEIVEVISNIPYREIKCNLNGVWSTDYPVRYLVRFQFKVLGY